MVDCSLELAAGEETENVGGVEAAGPDDCCKLLKNGFFVSASPACGEATFEAGAEGGVGATTTVGGGGGGETGLAGS